MNKTIKLRYHIYFWIIYFIFNVVRWGSYFNNYQYSFSSNLVEFSLHILIVYFNIYYLIPKLIFKKKYWFYFLSLLLLLAVHYVMRTWLNYMLVTEDVWPEEALHEPYGINHILAVSIGELYVIGITSAIKFTVDYIGERKQNEQLKELQYKTELKYLKAQMQPHFFFNTLNSLYALTLKNSPKAPDTVLRLSDIMGYIIYEANKKKLPLLKEIEYIENYMELEILRSGNNVIHNIAITGDMEDIRIPPLLFLPFIENCFKHGSRDENDLELNVSFEKVDNDLIFKATNNFDHTKEHQKGGIGLKNIKRRLEILYNKNFILETEILDDRFLVYVKIPI